MARLDGLLDELGARSAASLHVQVGHAPHARIRGDLVPLGETPLSAGDTDEMLADVLTAGQRAVLASSGEVTFVHAREGGARYLGHAFRSAAGLCAVLRSIPSRVTSLAELGVPESLWRLGDRRAGLVLVARPHGAGASRTAVALVDHVNKTRACHVVTIESPIGVVHEPLRAQITQREVPSHTPSYEAALDGVARDDVDVVLVGDVPSAAVARRTLELACSGVLVIACLAATSAVVALDELVGRAPSGDPLRGMLADVLAGVVAERVLPGEGSVPVVAYEVLLGSPAVAGAIREGGATSDLAAAMQAAAGQGMQSHDMAIERLLHAGRITAEVALEHATDRDALAKVIARSGARSGLS